MVSGRCANLDIALLIEEVTSSLCSMFALPIKAIVLISTVGNGMSIQKRTDLSHVTNTEWWLKTRKAQIINFSGEKSGNREWQRYGESNPGLMAENHLS